MTDLPSIVAAMGMLVFCASFEQLVLQAEAMHFHVREDHRLRRRVDHRLRFRQGLSQCAADRWFRGVPAAR